MNLPQGYHPSEGVWVKRVEFMDRGKKQGRIYCIETLVRSRTGRLLRVERSKRKEQT